MLFQLKIERRRLSPLGIMVKKSNATIAIIKVTASEENFFHIWRIGCGIKYLFD
jgi:hypothetical protein